MKHILLTILLFTLQSELSFAEAQEFTADEVQILEYCIENIEANELCTNAIPVIIGGEGGGVPSGDKMKQEEALAYIDVQNANVLIASDYQQELGRLAFKELTGLDLSGKQAQKLFKICLEEACGDNSKPSLGFGVIEKNLLQNKTNLILSKTNFAFRTIFGGEGGN